MRRGNDTAGRALALLAIGLLLQCGATGTLQAQPAGPAAAAAEADPRQQARELGAEARRLYGQGMYLQAAQVLVRAYALVPSPQILYNLARCMHKIGRLEEAIALYRRYLAQRPGAADRRQIERLLPGLTRQLASETQVVELSTEPAGAAVAVDGCSHWTCPGTPCSLRLRPGSYRFGFSLPGHRPREEELEVSAGEPARLDVWLEQVPTHGWLLVLGAADGARVLLDGEEIGTTPGPEKGWVLPPGERRVEVSAKGFFPWEITVKAVAGEQALLEPVMRRRPDDDGQAKLLRPGSERPPGGEVKKKRKRSRHSVWPWLAFGTAAACAAGGAGLGFQAYTISGQVLTAEEVQRLQQNAAMANVLFGLSGVSLAAGVMIYLLEASGGGEDDDEAARRGPSYGMVVASSWDGSGGSLGLLLRF